MDKYRDTNLKNWNERTPIHAQSRFYDVDGFKSGRSTLKNIEVEELGDVKEKSLLHLQCHFGLDTLSWAKLGAQATGVDFSDKAIDLAKSLSEETGLEARFICSDIYDLPQVLTDSFDIVFASYGVLCWIPDVGRWMKIAFDYLKPGGTFYIIDGHPFANVFDDDFQIKYSYFDSGEPIKCEPEGTYTDRNAQISTPNYQWAHSLSDIVNAVIQAELKIEFLHEFPFDIWERFRSMMREEDGLYFMKDPKIEVPLLFSIKAEKS